MVRTSLREDFRKSLEYFLGKGNPGPPEVQQFFKDPSEANLHAVLEKDPNALARYKNFVLSRIAETSIVADQFKALFENAPSTIPSLDAVLGSLQETLEAGTDKDSLRIHPDIYQENVLKFKQARKTLQEHQTLLGETLEDEELSRFCGHFSIMQSFFQGENCDLYCALGITAIQNRSFRWDLRGNMFEVERFVEENCHTPFASKAKTLPFLRESRKFNFSKDFGERHFAPLVSENFLETGIEIDYFCSESVVFPRHDSPVGRAGLLSYLRNESAKIHEHLSHYSNAELSSPDTQIIVAAARMLHPTLNLSSRSFHEILTATLEHDRFFHKEPRVFLEEVEN